MVSVNLDQLNKLKEERLQQQTTVAQLDINVWDEFDSKSFDPITFIFTQILKQLVSEGDKTATLPLVGVFYNPLGVKPAISISDYMKRLVSFMGCSYSCFVIALVYIDRMLQKDYTLNSYNVHRFLFGCVLVSIKFYDDYFYTTKIYATVGGLSIDETNQIERKILEELDFNIVVKEDEYNAYLNAIDERGYILSNIVNQQEEPEESDLEDSEDTTCDDSEDYIPKSASTAGSSASSLTSSTSSVAFNKSAELVNKQTIDPITITTILSKSSGIEIPKGPLSVVNRSRSLSNSFDMTIFKSKCPQLFISPSLKHRYRRNSYNQKLLNSTSANNDMNQSH